MVGLTVVDGALEIFSKAEVRVLQGLLQLGKPVLVVLAFEVALDGLQGLLDSLKPGVQNSHHIFGGYVLQELLVVLVYLGRDRGDLTDQVGACVVDELESGVQVCELLFPCRVV